MAVALSVCIGFLIGTTYGTSVTMVDYASQLADRFPVLRMLTRSLGRAFLAQLLLTAVMSFLFGLAFFDPRLSWVLVALGTFVGGALGWQLTLRLLVRSTPHRG